MQRGMTVARPKSSRVMIQQSLASGLGKAMAKRFGVPATVPKDKPMEVATLGHSRDRISYPLATGVTPMTILLTLQAMQSNSASMARDSFSCILGPTV